MQPLYTNVTTKKMTPSLSETTVTSVDNVFSVKQTETSCEQYNVRDKYFLMKHQKSVLSLGDLHVNSFNDVIAHLSRRLTR